MSTVTPSASILIADDDEISARFLKRLLTREGHHVSVVNSGEEALRACATNPPDLVLIDLVAPTGHGFDVCRRLKEQKLTRFIPIVIVTAQSDRRDRLDGINAGADDFVTKPFDASELHARIRSLVRLKRYTDELESAEAVILGRGGYLHDIGKIAVPDSVLLKDGKLDPQESRVMREHPIVGDALCAGLRSLQAVRPIVRSHHERLDGSGYPDGLKNAEVPLLAQIVSIVDVFDALTMERPYREARPRDEAFDVLSTEASKGWRDRALVDAFVSVASETSPRPPRQNH